MFSIPDWAFGIGFIILAGSIGRALIGRLLSGDQFRGRKGSRRDLIQSLDDLQRRLGELEAGQGASGVGEDVPARLAEVEERLDFVERMLAKQREAERLVPPKP